MASQVLVPLSGYGSEVRTRIALFVPLGHLLRPAWRRKLQVFRAESQQRYQIPISLLPSPPARARWMWNDTRLLQLWLRKTYGDCPVVLHARNATMTSIACQATAHQPQQSVVYDCRGAEPAEVAHRFQCLDKPRGAWPGHVRALHKQISAHEQLATKQSHAITCVSEALREYLIDQHAVERDKLILNPCCPDAQAFTVTATARAEQRQRLGLSGSLVIAYCGSLAWYQLPEASLRVFSLIKQQRADAKLLAITHSPQHFQQLAASAGIAAEDVIAISAPPHQVAPLLAAADYGLMLRDSSLVNRVASPVKFGEYLAAGVPVLISHGLGDYSQLVVDQRLGMRIDISKPDEQLAAELQPIISLSANAHEAMRERSRHWAQQHLSLDAYRAPMLALYQSVWAQSHASQS